MEEIMTKPGKTLKDAQGSTLSFRHKLVLKRDDDALAAHQSAGNEPKTELFDLREYQQDAFYFYK